MIAPESAFMVAISRILNVPFTVKEVVPPPRPDDEVVLNTFEMELEIVRFE